MNEITLISRLHIVYASPVIMLIYIHAFFLNYTRIPIHINNHKFLYLHMLC